MRQKVLPIVLPSRYQAALERQARASERDAVQQARWLLKQALAGALPAEPAAADRPSDNQAALAVQ